MEQNQVPLESDESTVANSPQMPSQTKLFILDSVKVILLSLAIIIPFRLLIAAPFIVDGDSMLPNYHNGEYLIVDEISKRFSDFKRGEVVVFHPPTDNRKYYIKRVIGLPGENIELADNKITISAGNNSQSFVLNEIPYLPNSELTNDQPIRYKLEADEYFLLGDHRDNSTDSRVFGPVKFTAIRGRTLLRVFPFNEFTLFSAPSYPLTK